MRAKRLLVGAVLASTALSAGCASCSYKAYTECLRPVEDVAVSMRARARVNVFFLNGADLLEIATLSELKDEVVAAGFPKAYYAQRFDREWYRRELHRLRREDPDNRFVLVGYGTAADQLRQLACQVTGEGIPLDMVVFIDPAFENADLSDAGFPSQVIRSQHWRLSPRLRPTETVTVPFTRHPNVPNSTGAVQQIVAILTGSAFRVKVDNPPVECVPEIDPKRPVPRPGNAKVIPPLPPEWQFLCPSGR